MSFIKLDKLVLGYGSKKIINEISIDINEGEYIYIIGENGIGKTTLVKGLLNLINPLSGKVIYNKVIQKNDVGYLPQLSTTMKNFPASVYEIVLSGTLNSSKLMLFYSKKEKKKIDNILKLLNIVNLKNKSFKDLSGGQQRRVLLARAMISSNKVLILDEPVAGLDPKAIKDFYEIIKKINKKNNLTILMVSHDVKAAVKYADKVLHLHEDGYCYGTVPEYKQNVISEYFLDGEE